MSKENSSDWDDLLSAVARLQSIIKDAVLVGGTASAIYARHRISTDADHILTDLSVNFDEVLAKLESVSGWKTARVNRPVLILGSLDGIETGIRQLIRTRPLETTQVKVANHSIIIPTAAEILRIKAALILRRNATRDYVDFIALANYLGDVATKAALKDIDQYYPQDNGQSVLQQLAVQLAKPLPFDLEKTNLSEYKNLDPRWHDWKIIEQVCQDISINLLNE